MDWFERLTGFEEMSWEATRARLQAADGRLRSAVNGASYGVGSFELASLGELRARVAAGSGAAGRLTVRNLSGDVRRLHRQGAFAGALFQVASQFNMLEMVGPTVTPEDGVTGYQHDHTQGPACAIAAGAATIWRNYFAPVGEGADLQHGQTAARQLDGLAAVGEALAGALGRPAQTLWSMENGYALPTGESLAAVSAHIAALQAPARDALAARLRIGLHRDVEVTDAPDLPGPTVSQAFCSALPVAYSGLPQPAWRPFAELVLDAAYEATLLAAVLNARRGASNTVLLTRLGGGAFGNADGWIDGALWRALDKARAHALDVVIVSYGEVMDSMRALEGEHPPP